MSPGAVSGRFALPADYPGYLRAVLDPHEDGEHLRHIQRTLPRYLERNPHTVIALAYFDLDLYESTRDALQAILPHLTGGSIVAFDELAHAKWPGETTAVRDASDSATLTLHMLPGRSTPVYLRWRE